MKILRFDSVGGASGDMILAALLDLGADPRAIRKQLAALPIEKFKIQAEKAAENSLTGCRVKVVIPRAAAHESRCLDDIRRLIRGSKLPRLAKVRSLQVFQCLAEAEARAHRTTPGKVRFHEVGAADSIVDIVGSCLALEMLRIEAVSVGLLPQGSGTVACDHGVLTVPAPATVEILKGHPILLTDETSELVTPTGAALLMTWKKILPVAEDPVEGAIARTGHGFGHRQLKGRPNLLRAMLLESASAHCGARRAAASSGGFAGRDECLVLECNVDDMTPELFGALLDRLMEKSALDAFLTPVQMKKQRPGMLLTVLCQPGDRDALLDLIFRESTTFGVREYPARRTVLARRHVEAKTSYGRIRVKVGTWQGAAVTRAPEYEDCLKAANRRNVPLRSVYEAALRALP
ncbi:MAG: nickel pincer cofactor biosynthesis protein LarC [Verrucomicrobiota bacterium]|nr:nickel pincer cofactor biosynthesis protein LarC [Verrucomicrobiota bacterium]